MRALQKLLGAITVCALANSPAFAQQVDDLTICLRGWREMSPEVAKMSFSDDRKLKACADFLSSGAGSARDRADAAVALGSDWESKTDAEGGNRRN